ncbi:MAG: DNA topoisomerase VI subunit B, partial [Bdellovibrionales bacterium]|nr:DNA topoisomerase VI subunit B [Bdellovibrionales bacterium]
MLAKSKITSSSTAEYFAKNLQQVGFSSPTKAVLTTLKEAIDNSLDACEEVGIAPDIFVEVKKIGKGGARNTDLIEVTVEDNGPGLEANDLAKVFGEYLASSKFGRGRASRGQQGIGISAATTWAQLTNAAGVFVISKTKKQRKATQAQVDVDIKGNKGLLKNKQNIDWDKAHGTRVTFRIDGRVQLNGDGGLLTYLEGTTLVNPHLELRYRLLENKEVHIPRVTKDVPKVPAATLPHPHTMKLGEFITHAGIYGKITFQKFLKTGFSRVTDSNIKDFVKNGLPKELLNKSLLQIKDVNYKKAFQAIQDTPLPNPSTRSVLTVGEESLSKSILRIGEVDFFSVVTRKPKICDHKPVVIEVALARFLDRGNEDGHIQLLRFANRVPLQFDKGACAITKAIESVNWRAYGLAQSKNNLPSGPYIFAVSVVSPFIKFKNASKETIDASDELVEEIRLAVMRAGQKLSRHIKRETKAADLERKIQHIEQFGPILVETLVRITHAPDTRKKKAILGLEKILGRDSKAAKEDLNEADIRLKQLKERMKARGIGSFVDESANDEGDDFEEDRDRREESPRE